MNKYEIRAQKEKERAIKRTLRKARVPKDATPEQVKAYLIHYVSKANLNNYSLRFTDEQLADPNFLLGLYRADNNMVNFERPNPRNKELIDNIDFMIEYLKLKHSKEMLEHQNDDGHWAQTELKWAVERYESVMANPEFIVRLAEAFPNQEIIPIIKGCIVKYHGLDKDRKEKEEQDLARYKECLSKLPIELLCEQVRKFGDDTLKEIPNDIPNFTQLISSGIETNGFRSLERLDITQVLDNIDLVVKAYKTAGIKALASYIQYTLSPKRTKYYMCHGEPHDYTEYDKRYEEVQKALLAAPEIQSVFKKEKIIAKIQEVKTTRMSIESCSSEEDTLIK